VAKRKRYTDEYRANAVLLLIAAGYPGKKGALSKVSRHLGISHQTLGRWGRAENNPPPPELVQAKKVSMKEQLRELFNLHIDAAGDSIKDADHHQVMGGLKITFESYQLLTGGPTANINQRTINLTWDANDNQLPETA
jgi:transposase-like protein